MAVKKHAFAAVREIGRALSDVEEGTTYGTPALKVNGKMFVCLASHKSAEPDTLVARIGFPQRDEMIATEPDTYYLKEHYVNYPVVLVRLSRVHADALRDLVLMAWRFTSATKKRRAVRPGAVRAGARKRSTKRS
jgi:hypothetical protein